MHSILSFRFLFSSKMRIFALSILLAISGLLHVNDLEALSWGKTQKAVQYNGTKWDEVYLDMDELYLTVAVPKYHSSQMADGFIHLLGEVNGVVDYIIGIGMTKHPTAPKTERQFVNIVKNVFPDSVVVLVKTKQIGAKYAADIIPVNHDDPFERIIMTEHRTILMSSWDKNEKRRLNFFNSIRIRR